MSLEDLYFSVLCFQSVDECNLTDLQAMGISRYYINNIS